MALETKLWDAAEFLNTPEDIAAYVEAAAQENNIALLFKALGTVARSAGMTEIAKRTGMSRESLYKALSEDGNPSFSTVVKVLSALDLSLTIQPKGANDSKPDAAAHIHASR